MKNNVIRLYEARPERLREHLNRVTGLNFSDIPQNLAELIKQPAYIDNTDKKYKVAETRKNRRAY